TKVDLGLYRLTLKNDARTGILNETTATINVSRMRSNFGYEFDLTAAAGNANISSSNTHSFLGEPEAPAVNRTLAVGPEGILSTGTINNVASISITGITAGTNDEVLEEISYDISGKKLKLTKSMLYGAPNKSYIVEFKDATGFIIQKLNLVVENPTLKTTSIGNIKVDQRLLGNGWTNYEGWYITGPIESTNWVKDINIAIGDMGLVTEGTGNRVEYIYRLNNKVLERGTFDNGRIDYTLGSNQFSYNSETKSNFFKRFAVRKNGDTPQGYNVVLLTNNGEEIEAIINVTGTTKGMTVGSGTLDTTTLLNNAITKINGGNPLLSNTAGSFVDAKGGLTS
ncbi:MAG: hypothetical protein ACRCX7_14320, partial [Cetobacterium sp.]|uniref:hypothetical protein n=1 Tax=Cetobacterium sp. TaxID=2071632 RepID=UPI003F301505